MELVILSGLSGAGKSSASRALEDMGFYCVDNIPSPLMEALIHGLGNLPEMAGEEQRYCLVTDVRSVERFGEMGKSLRSLKEAHPEIRIVFLEARDEVLLSRYKQTRRNHPLAQTASLSDAIREERRLLANVRAIATDLIDTSDLTAAQLREQLFTAFRREGETHRLWIRLASFGFKYGLPLDADLVLDVRFLANPYYVDALRPLSGQDPAVRDYVFASGEAERFLEMVTACFREFLAAYQREGKVRLNVAVGCTGGRHRSVAVSEALASRLRELGYRVVLDHRDLNRLSH